MTINELKKALPFLFKAGVVPHIIGHHGIGKSQTIKQFADDNGYNFIDLRLGQMADAGDILGLANFVKDESGEERTRFALPSFFPTKGKGILFLDEMNRATKDILQAVFQLVLDKRINEYKLPDGWHVVTASNPNTDDYSVTSFEDAAFLDRFCHIKLTPTVKEWVKWAKDSSVNGDVVAFIEEFPKLLETEQQDFPLPAKPSRRSYAALSRVMQLEPPVAVVKGVAYGLIGIEAGTAFFKFIKEGKNVELSAEQVVNNMQDQEVKDKLKAVTERHDVLNKLGDELVALFEKKTEAFSRQQELNFIEFCKSIPKDFFFGLFKRLQDTDGFFCTETNKELGFGDSDELEEYIKSL